MILFMYFMASNRTIFPDNTFFEKIGIFAFCRTHKVVHLCYPGGTDEDEGRKIHELHRKLELGLQGIDVSEFFR